MALPAQGFQKTPEEQKAHNDACPDTGSYFARIFKFMHVGTIKGQNFNGEEDWINKFKISFEILTAPAFVFDPAKGPQPWTASTESTYSTAERSNLYKYIKAIYKNDKTIMDSVVNGSFNPARLINELVMITTTKNISAKGNAYIKITSVSAPMQMPGLDLTAFRTSKLYNPCVVFDVDEFVSGNPVSRESFKQLYKFEQEAVAGSKEFQAKGLKLEDFQDQNKAVSQQGYKQQQSQQPVHQNMSAYSMDTEDGDVF
jgi:hypothetical protein